MEIKRLKESLWKARYLKGKKLTKREMKEICDGFMAMEQLGIYNKPAWQVSRKEVFKRRENAP